MVHTINSKKILSVVALIILILNINYIQANSTKVTNKYYIDWGYNNPYLDDNVGRESDQTGIGYLLLFGWLVFPFISPSINIGYKYNNFSHSINISNIAFDYIKFYNEFDGSNSLIENNTAGIKYKANYYIPYISLDIIYIGTSLGITYIYRKVCKECTYISDLNNVNPIIGAHVGLDLNIFHIELSYDYLITNSYKIMQNERGRVTSENGYSSSEVEYKKIISMPNNIQSINLIISRRWYL